MLRLLAAASLAAAQICPESHPHECSAPNTDSYGPCCDLSADCQCKPAEWIHDEELDGRLGAAYLRQSKTTCKIFLRSLRSRGLAIRPVCRISMGGTAGAPLKAYFRDFHFGPIFKMGRKLPQIWQSLAATGLGALGAPAERARDMARYGAI